MFQPIFQFRIENVNGSDEEWLELVVLGPPSMPMGPLECTDVTASTCKLHWLPPEDDGGVPIQGCISIEPYLEWNIQLGFRLERSKVR